MSDKEIDKLKELVEDCFALIKAQGKLINSQAEELRKPKVIIHEDKALQLKYEVLKREHIKLQESLVSKQEYIFELQSDIDCKNAQIKDWTYRIQNTYNGVV